MRLVVLLGFAFAIASLVACSSDATEGQKARQADDQARAALRFDACSMLDKADAAKLLDDPDLTVFRSVDDQLCRYTDLHETRFLEFSVGEADSAEEASTIFAADIENARTQPTKKKFETPTGVGDEAYALVVVDSTGYAISETAFRLAEAGGAVRASKPGSEDLSAQVTAIARKLADKMRARPPRDPARREPTLPAGATPLATPGR